MAQARAHHGTYIFQRDGSANWYVQLRSPGAKRKVVSLGTPDKLAAELIAGPMVTAHKAALLAARPRLVTSWTHDLEPGREHAAPDGGKIVATDRELIHIGHNGGILKIEPNGHSSMSIVGNGVLSAREEFAAFDAGAVGIVRPPAATKTSDDALIESYLSHARLAGHGPRETRSAWSLFRSLCSKPLKDCTRDDGRLLVEHYTAKGDKSGTMEKKIGRLRTAVNFAIKEGKLKGINPFAAIIPDLDDADRRLKLDDADMVAVRANIDALDDAGKPYLSEADRLLLRLLATTGMRLSEAFQIDGEQIEDGARFVIVGTKTDASLRRVPLPSALDVPAFTGPLFAAGRANRFAPETITRLANDTSKRLMGFLRNVCGIADPNKVVHSLRHRAQDQLRRAACPKDIREELLGHENKTVGDGYGDGHPVPMLKTWIDRIGF